MVVMSNEMTGLEALSLDFTAQVRERYERWLPERLAEVPESERDSFYSTLAEEIAERVQSLELALRGTDPEDEPFMTAPGPVQHGQAPSDRDGLGGAAPGTGASRRRTRGWTRTLRSRRTTSW